MNRKVLINVGKYIIGKYVDQYFLSMFLFVFVIENKYILKNNKNHKQSRGIGLVNTAKLKGIWQCSKIGKIVQRKMCVLQKAKIIVF